MNITYICRQMVLLLHGEIRRLGPDGEFREVYGNLPADFDPFRRDENFLREVLSREPKAVPDLFSERDFIYYGILRLENGEILLAGPVRVSEDGADLAQYMQAQHHLRGDGSYKLPYCDLRSFSNGLLLLFHLLTGKEVEYSGLLEETSVGVGIEKQSGAAINGRVFHHQETETPHNPYDHEMRKLEAIQNGDKEELERCRNEIWVGEYGRVAEDPLRQAKNLAVIAIVLASRAAIRGGLLPELAFSMADGYILLMESASDIHRVDAVAQQAENDFAREVAAAGPESGRNLLTVRAKDYIFKHLHGELRVSEIADVLGVHPNYLSTVFSREEGISIRQYICRERIRQSKNMLRYSRYSISEIAGYLSFSSQSHFSSCFRKLTSMTPGEYRAKFGQA